jgi:hypothetical protein
MRIHYKDDYAYDFEQLRDPLTQLAVNWKFTVFKLRPVEKAVSSGEADSREAAEKKAKRAISKLAEATRPAA